MQLPLCDTHLVIPSPGPTCHRAPVDSGTGGPALAVVSEVSRREWGDPRSPWHVDPRHFQRPCSSFWVALRGPRRLWDRLGSPGEDTWGSCSATVLFGGSSGQVGTGPSPPNSQLSPLEPGRIPSCPQAEPVSGREPGGQGGSHARLPRPTQSSHSFHTFLIYVIAIYQAAARCGKPVASGPSSCANGALCACVHVCVCVCEHLHIFTSGALNYSVGAISAVADPSFPSFVPCSCLFPSPQVGDVSMLHALK